MPQTSLADVVAELAAMRRQIAELATQLALLQLRLPVAKPKPAAKAKLN